MCAASRLYRLFRCSESVFVCALALVDRVLESPESVEEGLAVTAWSVHRLYLTCAVLAAKFNEDASWRNREYALIGGHALGVSWGGSSTRYAVQISVPAQRFRILGMQGEVLQNRARIAEFRPNPSQAWPKLGRLQWNSGAIGPSWARFTNIDQIWVGFGRIRPEFTKCGLILAQWPIQAEFSQTSPKLTESGMLWAKPSSGRGATLLENGPGRGPCPVRPEHTPVLTQEATSGNEPCRKGAKFAGNALGMARRPPKTGVSRTHVGTSPETIELDMLRCSNGRSSTVPARILWVQVEFLQTPAQMSRTRRFSVEFEPKL